MYTKPYRKQGVFRGGQSIIELVVYTAVVASIGTVVVTTLVSMQRAHAEMILARRVQDSAQTALERITRDAHISREINSFASSLGVHPGVVELDARDSSGNPVTYRYALSSGVLQVFEDGVLQGSLTDDDVSITSLIFREIETPISSALRVEMTIHGERGRASMTKAFQTTVLLRGSYGP